MSNYLKLSALALGLVCAGHAVAENLTAVSFGGANKQAQVKAFYQPWEAAGHGRIVAGEYNGEMAKVKAMVDTNSVSWNLVEVESPELARGCDEGLFEELDPGVVGNPDDFVEGAIQPCGVGFFVWSTVLAYNADKLKSAPSGWADFWDTEKFPGKRGLRKGCQVHPGICADGRWCAGQGGLSGAGHQDGQNRAFRKLDQLKPHIQWWEAGAQPPQFLASGDVVMSSAYNGRIAAVQNEQPADRLERRHLRLRFLGHPQGCQESGAGTQVHRLHRRAAAAEGLCREHRLWPGEHPGRVVAG